MGPSSSFKIFMSRTFSRFTDFCCRTRLGLLIFFEYLFKCNLSFHLIFTMLRLNSAFSSLLFFSLLCVDEHDAYKKLCFHGSFFVEISDFLFFSKIEFQWTFTWFSISHFSCVKNGTSGARTNESFLRAIVLNVPWELFSIMFNSA